MLMRRCAYVAARNPDTTGHGLTKTNNYPVEPGRGIRTAGALGQPARLTAHPNLVVAPGVRTNIIGETIAVVITQAPDGKRARTSRIIKLLTAPRSGPN